jgi:chromate transporter
MLDSSPGSSSIDDVKEIKTPEAMSRRSVKNTSQPISAPTKRILSFGEAFRFWLKLGFISFGGPAGQISIMHRELVDDRRWLSEERFLHALNYCMLLPGPEAHQLAIYIGWLMHKTLGGIVAGVLFIGPAIFILLVLSYIYAAYGHVTFVSGLLYGFKPVVVAIVVEAVIKIGNRALKRWVHYLIAALAFVAIYFINVPFPLIVLFAALIGLFGVLILPWAFDSGKDHVEIKPNADVSLVIDDGRALREHTLPNRRRLIVTLIAGLLLWFVPLLVIGSWLGWSGIHGQQYFFFTQAALVTFGGAYAVLAYVTQAAVDSFGWITQAQAVDGLALAETTPGPLIMVLQFIGFMAGWNNPPEGMSPAASGVIGAFLTTYATFLPSFLFVFVGAPYMETLRGNTNLNGALSGITAAVVGVILNLALVFGLAVIAPDGSLVTVDWFALILTVVAFIALYKIKLGVLWVILAGGFAGLARTFYLSMSAGV